MSEDDIDLDRVITDPAYRRQVIEFLNTRDAERQADNVVEFSRESDGGKARQARGSGDRQG